MQLILIQAVKKLYNDLEKYKNVDNSKIKEMAETFWQKSLF